MNKRYLITGIILTAILVAGVLLFRKNQPSVRILPSLAESQNKAKGPADAPVQIIEFSDFQCPACRKALPLLENLLTAYPGKIRVVYHHYPLPAHAFSALAHQAAECAAQVNKFWEYHDRLYQDQEQWSHLADPTEAFLQFARILGLNLDSFAQCLTDERIGRLVSEDKAKGMSLKITSTPTFFLNGERLLGGVELRLKGEKMVRQILGLPEMASPENNFQVPNYQVQTNQNPQ